MKILELGWEFPPVISGGLGTACRGICDGLSQLGHEITFLMPKAPDLPNEKLELIDAGSVPIKQPLQKNRIWLTIPSTLKPYLNESSYQSHAVDVLEAAPDQCHPFVGGYGPTLREEVLRYAEVAAALVENRSFDVIHAHDWMTLPAAMAIRGNSQIPILAHVHATEFDRSPNGPDTGICEIESVGLANADAVMAVSRRTKETLIEKYDISEDRIFVAYNAVNKVTQLERDSVKRSVSEKVVLYLGRVTGQKGPEYFVEAARKVLDQMDGVRFVMAGSGDLIRPMIERVAQHRMQRHFHFTGFLRGADVERMFALSDLYVMPSVSEPFGITPFEAMLFQVPIIVSRQSGIAEVLKHAPKVDYWDVDGLAQWMIRILSDPQLAADLVESGAAELEQVSWLNTAQTIDRVMRSLAS